MALSIYLKAVSIQYTDIPGSRQQLMSLMYSEESSGPKTEPYGTPVLRSRNDEVDPFFPLTACW